MVFDSGVVEEDRERALWGLGVAEINYRSRASESGWSRGNLFYRRIFTPDKLMLHNFTLVKLLDFNVAQQLESGNSRAVVGKHAYLPPEQFRGRATIRSDVYALGATMFFLLTGKDPEPISTSHPKKFASAVSLELDAIVARATETSQENRYPDSQALKADVHRLLRQSLIVDNS